MPLTQVGEINKYKSCTHPQSTQIQKIKDFQDHNKPKLV